MSYVSDGLVLGNWQVLPRQPSCNIRPIELPGTMNQAGATKSSPFAYTHWVYDVASKNIINQTYMVFIYLAPALQGLVCALWYRLVSRGIEVHQQKLPRGNFSFPSCLFFFSSRSPMHATRQVDTSHDPWWLPLGYNWVWFRWNMHDTRRSLVEYIRSALCAYKSILSPMLIGEIKHGAAWTER